MEKSSLSREQLSNKEFELQGSKINLIEPTQIHGYATSAAVTQRLQIPQVDLKPHTTQNSSQNIASLKMSVGRASDAGGQQVFNKDLSLISCTDDSMMQAACPNEVVNTAELQRYDSHQREEELS